MTFKCFVCYQCAIFELIRLSDDDLIPEECRNLLHELETNLSAVVTTIKGSVTDLDLLHNDKQKYSMHLQIEAKRVQDALNHSECNLTASREGLFNEGMAVSELTSICDTLEQEATLREQDNSLNDSMVLDIMLSKLYEEYPTSILQDLDGSRLKNSAVQRYLHRAWIMDQVTALKAHKGVLNKVYSNILFVCQKGLKLHYI